LREFLQRQLERDARARFGAEWSLALLIHIESARHRLGKVAEIEAEQRALGWRTIDVERKFALEIGGLAVRGQIDRIDRHEGTGAIRVLDYKTSDRRIMPAEAHLRALREDDAPRPWATLAGAEKTRAWADLQLPLYERALAAEHGPEVACGYFNLPKVVGETGVAMWRELTPDVRAAAWTCAEGVCAAIRAGEFWPPRELKGRRAEFDDFAGLFHQGAAASVAWPPEGGGR
jgi:ATP-dependent helicase/nuclease subunit B